MNSISIKMKNFKRNRILVNFRSWFDNHTHEVLLFLLYVLVMWSFWVIQAAGYYDAYDNYGDAFFYIKKYLEYLFFGILLFLLIQKFDIKRLKVNPLIFVIFAVFFCILASIPGIGLQVNGCMRYIRLFSIGINTGNFAVFLFVLAVSVLQDSYDFYQKKARRVAFAILSALLLFLVFIQPNDIALFYLFALVLAIVNIHYGKSRIVRILTKAAVLLTAVAILCILAYWLALKLKLFRLEDLPLDLNLLRLVNSVTMTDLYGDGWQLQQSVLGFVRGGIFGTGPGTSIQAMDRLPEAVGGFVFSVIGEEYGLIGLILTGAIFLLYLYLGLQAACRTRNRFESILCLNMTLMTVGMAYIGMLTAVGLLFPNSIGIPFLGYGKYGVLTLCISASLIYKILKRKEEVYNTAIFNGKKVLAFAAALFGMILLKVLYHDVQGAFFHMFDRFL